MPWAPTAPLVLAILALTLGGCGASPADQVRSEVQQLAQAAAHGRYETICQQILAPSLVAHLVSNGISCPEAMRVGLGQVKDPVVSVGRVVIRGSTAFAITLTSAQNQRATLVAIKLSRTGHGWRISSLASSLAPAEGR